VNCGFIQRALLSCAAVSGIALPFGARAQEAALQEVVVTAQKRDQDLIDVPVAVTALTADYLQQRDITSVARLDALAPGLIVNPTPTQPNNAQIGIRGSVQQNGDIVLDPSVGMYFDGVYIGKSQGAIFDIDDLERVEVLRGPQGTLYGRNTLAGAINFITNKPNGDLHGSAELGYGNYDAYTAKGMLNIPLTSTLFVKIAASSFTRHGPVNLIGDPYAPLASLYNNSVVQDPFGADAKTGRLGDKEHDSFLGQIRFVPNDRLTVDYSFDYSRARDTPDTTQLQSVNPDGFLGANCPYGPTGCIPAYLYVQPKFSSTASNDNLPQDYLTVAGHGLTVSWKMGDATLKSITGYRWTNFNDYPADLDGTPMWLGTGGLITSYNSFSQEFQLTGTVGDRVNYVAGVYYFHDNGETINPQYFFFGGTQFYTQYGGTTNAMAGYGQADYKLTDKLTLTAGLRYTQETKSINRIETLEPDTPLVDVPWASHRFYATNPTAIVAYKFTDDLNTYAKYAQGYRSGGFNGEAGSDIATTTPFNPETIDSYEVGVKSNWLERRLSANLAVFYNHHHDMQLSVFTAISALESLIENAGSATMKGVELETVFQPVDVLRLHANVAYLDATYNQFIDTNSSGVAVDVADNRVIPHAPTWQFSAGMDARLLQRAQGDSVHLLVDWRYTSSYYLYPYAKIPSPDFPLVPAASAVEAEALGLLDAQFRWEDVKIGSTNAWVSLWGRNLTNTVKKQNGIDFGASFGDLNIASYNEPRTYGVSVGLKF
jgi:iron complex outermembrane recepter protein